MSATPMTPEEMRAYIVERLTGETGEPDRVTQAARIIVETALPAIKESLKQTLALDLPIEITGVEVSRIADAKPDSDNWAMCVAVSASGHDDVVVTMDTDAIALAVSALFGGDPGVGVAPIRRDLSPTETVVASRIFAQVVTALVHVEDGPLDLALPAPPAISGAEMHKRVLRDAPGARVTLSVTNPSGNGTLILTMPQRLLLKGTGTPAHAGAGQSEQWGQRFSAEVMRSGVNLQATMPLARMTLGQIAGLQVGQVIEFEPDAQSQAKLSARQKTLFVCEFGKLGQNYTVRVRHPFDAGQDMMEGLVANR